MRHFRLLLRAVVGCPHVKTQSVSLGLPCCYQKSLPSGEPFAGIPNNQNAAE
jgi:hypothetical protein